MATSKNRYRRWGAEDSEDCLYLKQHYLGKNNSELAQDLGRTVDSVRKQMKKLGLKRPRKSRERKEKPKKRGRKPRPSHVFDMVKKGHKNRRKREKERKRLKRLQQDKEIEKKKVTEEITREDIPPCPDLTSKLREEVTIDGMKMTLFASTPEKMKASIKALENRHKKINR